MDPFDLRLWNGFLSAGGNPALPAITDQITIDSRRIDSNQALFVALEGKVEDGHRFISRAAKTGARFILAKKGWIPDEPLDNTTILLVDDPIQALQQIAGAYRRQLPCKVVAIAGSYGKTMVKDLLQDMLKTTFHVAVSPESFNSQIGVPLSLLTIKKEHDIALIEAGISEKDEMDSLSQAIGADFGIITHIGKKHLSTLGDLDTVAAELVKIIKQLPATQWAIIPKDPHLLPHIDQIPAGCHFWTIPSPCLPHAYFSSGETEAKMPYHIDFPDGRHHFGQITSGFYYFLDLINITSKAAWLLGAPSEAISRSLQSYTPEPMRTELWKSSTGPLFINDIYCSDPQSIDAALKHFHQAHIHSRRVFIFGGMRGKHRHTDNDYKRIGKAICRAKVELLLLFGIHDFNSLIDEIKKTTPMTVIFTFCSYHEALTALQEQIKQEDVILIKGENKYPINSVIEAFNDSICSNQCFINLAAISENIQIIRCKTAHKMRCMVMVKALAYGTNEIIIAKFLETCHVDILGVSYADEGVSLKRAGVSQSIFVINAAIYEAAKIVKWDLEIGVSDSSLIKAMAEEGEKQNKTVKVHLHVDTGMNRFGCRPEEALELARLIESCRFLKLEGIMTHFACADDPEQDLFTHEQASRFDCVIAELKGHGISPQWRHAANSSGCLRFHFPQYNMMRIGLAVYGLYASQATKEALELRLALSLVSHIAGINFCKQGETISYGRSYRIHRDEQKIAVLPMGYFDGLHRNYSGKGAVIIRGQQARMVGKICMDFMMVDVTDIQNASPGDPVLIFGEDEHGHYLSPEELAAHGNSIIHELITCMGPRIQRIFICEEARRTH